MSKYIVDGATMTAIANAIRSKTGSSGSLTLDQMPTAITGITSGGGSSADVRYVTFLDEDGTQLYKKPVAVGDDCADIIARGLISAPTKSSTAQYNYAFAGWALTSGGSADPTALQNVTQDRTVYAAFSANLRYYTVRFYDGETLVDTVQVAYGGTANTQYAKDGYDLVGWTPSNINITADTDCYGEWTESETITDSWETIAAHSLDGTASQTYSVGDTKKIVLTNTDGSTETVFVAIAGFGLHRNANGVKEGITFIRKGHSSELVYMQSLDTVDIDAQLYDKLPADLKAVIKQSTIDTKTYDSGTVTTATATPYMFAPELSNISTSIKGRSGNSRITSTLGSITIYGTEYSNDQDAGIFPIFQGKTLGELASFLKLSNNSLATRTAVGGKSSNIYLQGHIGLVTNDTYTVCKISYGKNSNHYYTFCFRV